MAAPPAVDIQPLMYEHEAAKIIGIPPRALRSERTAGRIGFRKVAGRIMYRQDDLIAWQELIARPALSKDRSSDPIPRKAAYAGPTSNDGAAAVQRARATVERLLQVEREKKREKRVRDKEEAERWRAERAAKTPLN
jgi:DNA-binding transcriptional MerR regulator